MKQTVGNSNGTDLLLESVIAGCGNGNHLPGCEVDLLKSFAFHPLTGRQRVLAAIAAGTLPFRQWAIKEGHSPRAIRRAVAECEEAAFTETFGIV